jgi:putative transposase
MLTAKRDEAAARRLFERAVSITIDKSGANTPAVRSLIADCGADIELRESK